MFVKLSKTLKAFLLSVALMVLCAGSALAWGDVITTLTGTHNPHAVNESGLVEITSENTGATPALDFEIGISPMINPGLKIVNITVELNGKVVCRSKPTMVCPVGDLQPGDVVFAKMRFRGKEVGKYPIGWYVQHDGMWVYNQYGISVQ